MSLLLNASINVKLAGGGGGRQGIGRDFDIFQKTAVKFPTPGKNVRSNITKFPTPRNDLWSRAQTKIQISLPPGQQENSNALSPGQSNRSKSRPMPRLPPRRLDIDRCITIKWKLHCRSRKRKRKNKPRTMFDSGLCDWLVLLLPTPSTYNPRLKSLARLDQITGTCVNKLLWKQ